MTRKSCPYCYCTNVHKHGTQRGRMRYRCKDCRKTWSNLPRPGRRLATLWHEYTWEGATVMVLARRYRRSLYAIRCLLGAYQPPQLRHMARAVTVIMDVTYFGAWGILVALDPNAQPKQQENTVLYWVEVQGTERTLDYEVATDTLESLGYHVQAAVIDGRRGVRQMLEHKGIPVQYCHFHQLQTITQCLTKRPKLIQNKALRTIALTLTHTTKEAFVLALDDWHDTYGEWLKERYCDPTTGRTRYQHDRTRRAYFSLRRNLDYLFTYQDEQLTGNPVNGYAIPNTTNALDGRFGVWKDKLKDHRGCSKQLKITMLRSFFSGRTD